MSHKMIDDPIDPQLLRQFQALRETPPRDPQAAVRSQARFLTELDETFAARPAPITGVVRTGSRLAGWLGLQAPQRRAITSLGLALAVLAFVWSGTSAAARAAQVALPGDALYPLKTGLEQARITVNSRDARSQVALYLEIAEHRLDEMEGLAEVGDYPRIASLAEQFQGYIAQVRAVAAALAQTDPAEGAALNAQIDQALAEFAHHLRDIAEEMPASALGGLQPALDAAHVSLVPGAQETPAQEGGSGESQGPGSEDHSSDQNTNLNGSPNDANVNAPHDGPVESNENTNHDASGGDEGGNENVNDSSSDKGDNENINASGGDEGDSENINASGGDKGGNENTHDSGGGKDGNSNDRGGNSNEH